MHEPAAVPAPIRGRPIPGLTRISGNLPTLGEGFLASGSALLLILSLPNFDLWWLAWIGLVPLIVPITRAPVPGRAFVLGLIWGTIFFYGSCWWLTYSMIHYGGLSTWLAYPLLLPVIVLVAIFPAVACALLAQVVKRFGPVAVFAAPIIWVAADWIRYGLTGQLWNAVGYSQAYHPALIQTARWGGVCMVSFFLVLTNTLLAYALLQQNRRAVLTSVTCLLFCAVCLFAAYFPAASRIPRTKPDAIVVAVQANVPMDSLAGPAERDLLARHFSLSIQGTQNWRQKDKLDNVNAIADNSWANQDSLTTRSAIPALVIWPESPMSFSYSRDPELRNRLAAFAQTNHISIMLNSLEPAPNDGSYNSAIMVNEEGRIVAQYDKIRLMPFGEYVPLPRWLPGASSVRSIVGEFTSGSSYTLMPLGAIRAGAFICIEASHPGIAREFANSGANVLINISNDGYLGPTAVMRQHLANAIFRAVENDRPLIRVTNNGISAFIEPDGRVTDATPGFEPAVRTWGVANDGADKTFYTRHGDVFAYLCLVMAFGLVAASFSRTSKRRMTSSRG